MNSNAWEVTLPQELVKLCRTNGTLNKDDDLVEFKVVKEFVEFAVLFCFAEFDVVLLKTMQGEFGIVIDIHLERVSHELLANRTDLLGKSGTEHHHLLISRSRAENLLNISTHV